MDDAAHGAAVGQRAERPAPERVGELVHEAGVDQQDEQHHQHEVLQAHPAGQPQFAIAAPDGADVRAGLAEIIEQIERRHPADGHHNQRDVEPGDEIHDPRLALRRAGRRVDAEELRAEPGADAGMALAAGLRQVLGIDRGARIAGGQNVVDAVAGSAIGRGEVAALQGQAMEALHVGREHVRRQPVLRDDPLRGMTLAAGFGDVGRRHARRGQLDGGDGVLAMAVGADGRVAHAGLDRRAVNAAEVGLLDVFVAFAAGAGNVLPVELGRGVGGPVQVVRAVAIGADRGVDFALLQQGDAVDALLVADDGGTLAEMKLLHLRRVAVAPPAGLGQIGAIHRRLRVAVVQQIVVAAVAILAGGRFLHALVDRLAVVAFQVNLRLDAMALAAGDRLGDEVVRMRQIGDVGVATGAEVLGVDGGLEFRLVHVQRDGLAGGVGLDQRLVAVAGDSRSCRGRRRSGR